MNHSSYLKALGLSVCLSFGLVACQPNETEKSTTEPTTAPQPAPQESVSTTPSPAEQTLEGELRTVSLDSMTFALRDASGMDKTFSFSTATRITGAAGVQALTGKQGSHAKVTYIAQGDTNQATSIDIMEQPLGKGQEKSTK